MALVAGFSKRSFIFSMSRYTRPGRLMVHAVGFLGILSSTASVTATPIPFPFSRMAADYSLGLVTLNRTAPGSLPSTKLSASNSSASSSLPTYQIRNTESDSLGDLLGSYDSAATNGDILSKLH